MSISNTYRFFIAPDMMNDDTVTLTDAALVHQMAHVLRLRPGNEVLLLDGLGTTYRTTLTAVGRTSVSGQITAREASRGEPALMLTLYVPLLRAERFEWVLQKGTELGVSRFIPTQCTHSLAADRADAHKLERWTRIVREAAEQSCRGRLPVVSDPQPFVTACATAATADLPLLLWESTASGLRSVLRGHIQLLSATPLPTIAILSGPEGGLTSNELTTATEHGMIPVTLGARILRAETASIAATAAIFYELEW